MIATWPAEQAKRLAPSWIAAPIIGLLIYILARPMVALAHELAILAAAGVFSLIHHGSAGWALVRGIPGDPVYTGAVASLLSDVDAAGLALADPIGSALHARWPQLFLDPALVPDGAFVSALILPGSTLVARGLSFLLADILILAFGWLLWLWATSGPRSVLRLSLAFAAAIQQLHVVFYHHLVNRVTLQDLESLGVPFALSALQRGAPQDRPRVTAWLANIPAPVIELVVNVALATFVASLGFAIAMALRIAWLAVTRRTRPQHELKPGPACRNGLQFSTWLWLPALVLAASPLGAFADADSRVLGLADETIVTLQPSVPVPVQSLAAVQASTAPVPQQMPVRVEIQGSDFHYRYLVDGRPTTIKGMGYNVRYAHLPDDVRRDRYDRDFALMRSMGVNTVVGWEAAEFDELMLDRAAVHGLGVIPPLELRPDVDYSDEAVRAQITADALAWVERYKGHPAIRVWALGNEILHKLVYPSWMPVQSEPWREERARAFAQMLITLADRVHAADPLHPVVYTDAEDAYVRHVREAFAADGQARPWFVYGINVYTPRLRAMIDTWPTVGFDTPLFISEFAPGGLSSQDRPAGLRDMWDVVESFEDRALGGAVYAWTTDGPEEVDRVFGLTNADGGPLDGALNAVAGMFGGDLSTARGDPASAAEDPTADSDEPLHEIVRTAFAALEPELEEDVASTEEATDPADESPSSSGRFQVARVVDATAPSARDADDSDDAWWVTWRSGDRRKRQLAMLVERDDNGQPRVYYVHRPRQ